MIKVLNNEDYILWKSAEWGVSEEEARRIIENQDKAEKYIPYFSATVDQEVEIPF